MLIVNDAKPSPCVHPERRPTAEDLTRAVGEVTHPHGVLFPAALSSVTTHVVTIPQFVTTSHPSNRRPASRPDIGLKSDTSQTAFCPRPGPPQSGSELRERGS